LKLNKCGVQCEKSDGNVNIQCMNRQCGMQIQVCKNETHMALRVCVFWVKVLFHMIFVCKLALVALCPLSLIVSSHDPKGGMR
jgi:hypothetical protein